MTGDRTTDYLVSLIHEPRKLPNETSWVELKVNKADPEDIGEYISARANSAALAGKANAYLVWGIDDGSHALVGTRFHPGQRRGGSEELERELWRILDQTPFERLGTSRLALTTAAVIGQLDVGQAA